MKLGRWDIVFVPVDEKDTAGHPAVILSPEDILEDPRRLRINVLMGTKRVPASKIGSHHVVLNGADGLDFQTVLDCSFVYVVRKSSILRAAGVVGLYRRQEIQRKIRSFLGLS
jgi:mRNA-degrading endonuclease toxin of MazEF toxin-antitoxin module